ncbi:hypothetical protein CY34DRAFT_108068 [Suillus luteus UH-Slu-Lm8-n1]|uniref:Uncharacterized protein n=1 Tax=Suillus luteus UH-Slu-Lm8-n1 TaxID=930992 RepID=A0A0D0ADM8_9AGAM|nr:hypothetical protein CY34DRAFT_108068 [Suillus luteus UH-Slu-Lm8-n1]
MSSSLEQESPAPKLWSHLVLSVQRSTLEAPLSITLPSYSGRYPVGIRDKSTCQHPSDLLGTSSMSLYQGQRQLLLSQTMDGFLKWPNPSLDEQPKNDTRLRHFQLEVRKPELELSIAFLKANKYRRPAYLEGVGIGRLGPARTLQARLWQSFFNLGQLAALLTADSTSPV